MAAVDERRMEVSGRKARKEQRKPARLISGRSHNLLPPAQRRVACPRAPCHFLRGIDKRSIVVESYRIFNPLLSRMALTQSFLLY